MGSIRRSIRAALDLFVFSVPITVSLFAELLTAVTDTFLAGHLGGQSAHALAAMSFAAPVIGLFAAVQSLFALPIGVVVARCIDDRERRDARFFFATTACAGVSVCCPWFLLRISGGFCPLSAPRAKSLPCWRAISPSRL